MVRMRIRSGRMCAISMWKKMMAWGLEYTITFIWWWFWQSSIHSAEKFRGKCLHYNEYFANSYLLSQNICVFVSVCVCECWVNDVNILGNFIGKHTFAWQQNFRYAHSTQIHTYQSWFSSKPPPTEYHLHSFRRTKMCVYYCVMLWVCGICCSEPIPNIGTIAYPFNFEQSFH